MTTVDWGKPIEAVHTDGRVVAVTFAQQAGGPGDTQPVRVTPAPSPAAEWFALDGSHPFNKNWSIRNVEQPTQDEATTRALALVERMATDFPATTEHTYLKEARAIQKLRTPPVDPRLDLVVRSLVGNGVSKPVAPLFARDVLKALDAAE